MTSSLGAAVVLLAAGALAGLVGSAGGITSLISYPALLVAGVPALAANVANLVAVVACWPGSALTSRRELSGTGQWLTRGLPVTAGGGAVGAALLLATPAGTFSRVVPFLVAAGSLALLCQPWLTARRRRHRDGQLLALVLLGIVSVYGGYFGAGSGVMVLALVLVLVDSRLPRANAVKNMVIGGGTVAAAAVLVVAGPVEWSAVLPLAVGLFAGSTAGPVIARRVPAHIVRQAGAALGFTLAVELWLHAG
jgi:uncharacterized membrane protein YfcA